jgi:hypothetical protein
VQKVAIGHDRTLAHSFITGRSRSFFWVKAVSNKSKNTDFQGQAEMPTHLDLPARAPPRSPAWRVDLLRAA